MKKNLLIVGCLFLTLAGPALATEIQNSPTNAEVKQKACQNVFSFINIDLSVMSPRAAVSDVSVAESVANPNKNTAVVPIANKPEPKQEMINIKSRTSLFRLDLLHLFKIQVF